MTAIETPALPANSLLHARAAEGAYVDCFAATVPGTVSLGKYLRAFYTGRLFRVERLVLGLLGHGSRDSEIDELLGGTREQFSAWRLEARAENQIQMRDVTGRTGNWFQVESAPSGTRLYFGSCVMPRQGRSPRQDSSFRLMLRFHIWYSRALLGAAVRRLT